jgi:homoserine dehydrogenase
MLYGAGAGGRPTASAVLGDLVDAARHLRTGPAAPVPPRSPARLGAIEELRCPYYLSIDVVDRPGVLAAVAKVFGDHGVSIRAMEQLGLGEEARLIFLTHTARHGDVVATLAELRSLPAVDRIGGLLRVVAEEDAPPADGRG